MKQEILQQKTIAALWSLAIGDALGVPVEFKIHILKEPF